MATIDIAQQSTVEKLTKELVASDDVLVTALSSEVACSLGTFIGGQVAIHNDGVVRIKANLKASNSTAYLGVTKSRNVFNSSGDLVTDVCDVRLSTAATSYTIVYKDIPVSKGDILSFVLDNLSYTAYCNSITICGKLAEIDETQTVSLI